MHVHCEWVEAICAWIYSCDRQFCRSHYHSGRTEVQSFCEKSPFKGLHVLGQDISFRHGNGPAHRVQRCMLVRNTGPGQYYMPRRTTEPPGPQILPLGLMPLVSLDEQCANEFQIAASLGEVIVPSHCSRLRLGVECNVHTHKNGKNMIRFAADKRISQPCRLLCDFALIAKCIKLIVWHWYVRRALNGNHFAHHNFKYLTFAHTYHTCIGYSTRLIARLAPDLLVCNSTRKQTFFSHCSESETTQFVYLDSGRASNCTSKACCTENVRRGSLWLQGPRCPRSAFGRSHSTKNSIASVGTTKRRESWPSSSCVPCSSCLTRYDFHGKLRKLYESEHLETLLVRDIISRLPSCHRAL